MRWPPAARSRDTLDLVADVRRQIDVPIVLFTYVNPVLRMGVDAFVERAAAAGVDGVLLLDMPDRGIADAMHVALDRRGIDQIFLISPTTTDERLREAARARAGVSVCDLPTRRHRRARLRSPASAEPLVERDSRGTTLPVALGFGISRPEHVREVIGLRDAAVVGSALVQGSNDEGGGRRGPASVRALADRCRVVIMAEVGWWRERADGPISAHRHHRRRPDRRVDRDRGPPGVAVRPDHRNDPRTDDSLPMLDRAAITTLARDSRPTDLIVACAGHCACRGCSSTCATVHGGASSPTSDRPSVA